MAKIIEQVKILSDNELAVFLNYLNETYQYFLFNRTGHDIISGKIYHNKKKEKINFEYIWNTILRSSEFAYLAHLANIFDKEYYEIRKGDKKERIYNICIRRIIIDRAKFIEHKSTLIKIEKIRNKILDHTDSNVSLERTSFLAEFGLDPEGKDIQSLFDKIFELLDIKQVQKGYERIMKEKFMGWYDIFSKGYPKSFWEYIMKQFIKRHKTK